MKKTIALFAVLAFAFSSQVNAQLSYSETNNLFYHTLRTPQSTFDNAAFFPTNNTFYLMLPGLDLQVGSPLGINDVIYYDKVSNHTLINLDTIFHRVSENNKFRLAANVNILGFGLKVGSLAINVHARLINNINFGLPISTINAVLHGNIDDNGAAIPEVSLLNGDILNVTSYLETAIGAAYKIKPINLTVGVRAKMLWGVGNVQTDNTKIVFNTESNLDSVSARMYYEIQSSTFAPYDTVKKEFVMNMGDIIANANTGLAFDIGAKYDLGPFSFSFAINDLTAGIHWKNNVVTWRPEGGQGVIEFNGLDVNTMLDNGTFNVDSLTNYLKDQLTSMTPERDDAGDYWFSIPTKINLGASFSFAKLLRAGLLLHGQFDRGLLCKSTETAAFKQDISNTFRFNTTLTLGANLFNWAEVIIGSSFVYDGNQMDFFNPGVGLVFTPGTVLQFYLMADYISSFYLIESKALNLKFGLNILIGKGGRSVVSAD